ncbi:hypothetical protein KIH86_11085 [Paenibacillus sp. HN-1]|uniref:GAP1-N2 domain-containing protein n=1 Tax=Paenibacillus TaxID=44249 RepID=UPI001CA8CF30|nr:MULTISPECIES: hypothetical protein [Paenibacillus]MBY9077457.1 hypothetical protein [Paenibacillus sp. CGMCC 1.18879]MBY9084766.1 hypothetical protein [Paenibacillus sinensis]
MGIQMETAVQQQMYTRQRSGVFRSTEGFDTVAKSGGLDNNFIKKVLHPFCFYDAPAELAAKGEKDESQYPLALHLFHLESGETVLGQSRFQSADFTGLRSAFFTHNYVLPPSRADEIVTRFSDYLNAEFADGFTGEPGEALPELAAVPASGSPRLRPEEVLRTLGISEDLFKSLLHAAMQSIAGKKKIYVTLNVPVAQLPKAAADLTGVLLGALPFEFRRRLGVLTYAAEPQSRKYIHLTFVESGSLRPGDREIEKEYLFDLAAGRTQNTDLAPNSPKPFLDLAWELLRRGKEASDDFGAFADGMLQGEGFERKLSLAAYNELAVFYRIEQGDEELYRENKAAVLGGLLSYLDREGALETKIRLNDLFLERFDREFDEVRQKGVPELAILESFRDYFSLKGHNYRTRIVDYFINGMLNAQNAGRDDNLAGAFGVVESSSELAAAFFGKLLGTPVFARLLFQPYVDARLASAERTADLMEFVADWDRFMPEALRLPALRDGLRDYLPEKLEREEDSVMAVAAIHDYIEQAEKSRRRGAGIGMDALALMKELAAAADRYLLSRLSLEEITQEQLLELNFVRYSLDMGEWDPPLDLQSRRKANVLRAAYRWFGEEDPDAGIFEKLAPQELDDVQLLGQRWLKESRGAEPFARIPLAFYHSMNREGGPLEYDSVLDHVRRKAGDKETVYRFLAWSQDKPLFAVSSKKLYPGFRRAILKHFAAHDREAFKSRDFRKNELAAAGPALQGVYTEARNQVAPPLRKWASRRFPFLLGTAVIVLLAATLLVVLLTRGGGNEAAPAASPAPTGTAMPSAPAYLPAAVYLGGGEDERSLLFAFASADDCRQFNPAEVTVETGAGEPVIYKVSSLSHGCSLPGGSGAASGTAAPEGSALPAPSAGADDSAAAADNAAGGASPSPAAGGDDALASPAASGDDAASGTAAASASPGGTASPAPGGGQGAAGSGIAPYQVTVTLASKPKLSAGSTIKAEDYTLVLMDNPQAASASPSPSAGETAAPAAE